MPFDSHSKVAKKPSCPPGALQDVWAEILTTTERQDCSTCNTAGCVLQDAEQGTRTHGIVTGVKEYGVFVALWGGLKGLAHSSELGLAPGQTPQDSFQEGQVSASLELCLQCWHAVWVN